MNRICAAVSVLVIGAMLAVGACQSKAFCGGDHCKTDAECDSQYKPLSRCERWKCLDEDICSDYLDVARGCAIVPDDEGAACVDGNDCKGACRASGDGNDLYCAAEPCH